jgi:hypothetical protein
LFRSSYIDLNSELEAARLRSEQIDAELASEAALKAQRRKNEVHILVLGKLIRSTPSFMGKAAINPIFDGNASTSQVHQALENPHSSSR